MAEDLVLEARELYRFYHAGEEETLALRGVSLVVKQGELVAVMGPSGSGKSTLLACVAGLVEPDGGTVIIAGERMTRRPESERAALRATALGIMTQAGSLFDQLSVRDNVRLKKWLAGRKSEASIDSLATSIGISARLRSRPSRMSGGEMARAALAVALAADPALLLADEPTGEVDATAEAAILELLDSYRNAGGAALVATHSDSLAARMDRVIRLRDGRIIHDN